MSRNEYFKKVLELYNTGQINEETCDVMIMNADAFCDEEECGSYGLPSTYAEVEYDDFNTAEAVDGARFDDMNYLRYTER